MMPDTSRSLLIVEDDLALQKQIQWSLDQLDSATAHDRESALVQMRRCGPAVVTMDLGLPPEPDSVTEGFRLLEQLIAFDPDVKVIVLTGQNDQANALRAVAMGAYDFFAKPFTPELLTLTIDRAFRLTDLQRENRRLQTMYQPDALSGLITRDPDMLRICRMVEKVAPSNASVMLLGDSGTGKEVLARALHQSSSRKSGKFVAINCAAIPDNLLESELFGFERGAFTGAAKTTQGKIELANGGTLMLDEIGDLPFALQAKLLRFLQERTIERVGGRQEIAVDVRIVCATHQDLNALSKEGRFREDLYYRLAEVVVNIPPLRQRVGDAALLAHALLRRYAHEYKRPALRLSEDAVRAVESYAWPGNIRELENRIKRAAIMADGSQISCSDMDLNNAVPDILDTSLDLRQARDRAEKAAIIAALGRVNGNIVRAAELLGVSRPTLYDLMHRLSLK
ncbi:MAG: PEP-CTERM-box response regulator transcription factor [Rhodoferax sp.]|nr:PEP-CTERM-box response regulator transcription factor [Rhodoferax sp.]